MGADVGSPRPACGERSDCEAIRVRGTIRESGRAERAPHPDPLPARAGRGRSGPPLQPKLITALTLLPSTPMPRPAPTGAGGGAELGPGLARAGGLEGFSSVAWSRLLGPASG